MSKTLNTVIWVILFILIVPSSLIVASWNSLPGSHLYQFKLFAEQALVTIVPNDAAKGSLQIAFTQRRFDDAKKLLADNTSGSGLSYLDTQITTTKQAIVATNDPVVKRQLAQKYIAALQDVNTQLEAQKQVVQATNTAPRVPTPAKTGQGAPTTPTPTPVQQIIIQQQTVVVYQIVQTQTQIVNTIQEIQQQADVPETTPTPTPTVMPTPTPAPTPTPVPPTPTPKSNNGNGDGWGQGGNPGSSGGNQGGKN